MAVPKIKSTYSLGTDAAEALDRLAASWSTSKSEALRRLILRAADAPAAPTQALDELQARARLSRTRANAAATRLRAERLAGSSRRERA